MAAVLSWEFVKEFHHLPPSDRRPLLKALSVEGVSHFDEPAFFGWLAGLYQCGEIASIDGAVWRKINKPEERAPDPALYAWLLTCTQRQRRRAHDQRSMSVTMAKEVLAKGGDNADLLRALAPNFPWLDIPQDEAEALTAAATNPPPEPQSAEAELEDSSTEEPATSPADVGAVVERLASALTLLHENPEPTLVEWAVRLADAIETHTSSLSAAAEAAEQLVQRRANLAIMLARLDSVVADRIGEFSAEILSAVALDRIEAALLALDKANDARASAKGDVVAALDAPPDERTAAYAAYDKSATAYEAAVESLASEISRAKSTIASDDGSASQPPVKEDESPKAEPQIDEPLSAPPADGVPVETVPLVTDTEDAELPIELDVATFAVDLPETIEVAPFEDDIAAGDQANADGEAANAEPMPTILPPWDDWILRSLEERRLGLALHLADGRHLSGADLPASIPPAVLEALLRSTAVHTAYSRFWISYEELKTPLLQAADGPDERKIATDLLLFAGAIRPAIVQSTAALSVIDALDGEVAAWLQPLRTVIADVAQSHIAGIAEIAAPADLELQRQRLEDVRKRLEEWRDAAPARKTNYQPATLVWNHLISADGPIGKSISAALASDEGAAAQIQEWVADLDDDSDQAIDDAHTTVSRGIRKDAIEGNARKQLRGLIASATELLGEWIDIQGVQGAREDRFRLNRNRLLSVMADARRTVLAASADRPAIAVICGLFNAFVLNIEDQLRGTMAAMPYPDDVMDSELALLAQFPLNARRSLRIDAGDVEDLATAAASAFSNATLSTETAFDEALRSRAASTALRLLDRLPPNRAKSGAEALNQMVWQARREIGDRLAKLRQRLDDLQIATTAGSAELDELERSMTSFEQLSLDDLPRDVGEPGTIADFPTAERELQRLERTLDRIRAPLVVKLEARIAALEAKFGGPLQECRDQLARGDLGTLNEEVDQIEKHGPAGLPDSIPTNLLVRFTGLLRDLGEKPSFPFGSISRTAREGANRDGFDFSSLSSLDRDRAVELLDAWIALRRATQQQAHRSEKKGDPLTKVAEAVPAVLKGLGWSGVRVTDRKRETNWYWISVATVALRHREYCPIPAFGSECVTGKDNLAHYAVVVAGPDDLAACLGSIENLPKTVLLLVTEPLNAQQRRELRRKARRSGHSIAVADALTIAMLAMTPEAATGHFFELAVPYGNAQPYADKETAIENFFGRENELDTLLDPYGASFVYGGRQLGKTALLRQIELRQRDNPDRVAVYCYIKPVGESLSADSVWDRIRAALVDRGLALAKSGLVPDQIKSWVQDKPGRYLLIMLDEADAFLESEMANNFPQIERMKALMAGTGRSIKFVFAGLHNVQRFYRAPNSPLVHLGAPVNVGPLLGTDRRAARQMALEPMAALGFTFKDTIDAYHMLSLIGFYPSLMQSFGKAVVTAMNKDVVRAQDGGPIPAVITRTLIDACFRDPAFRAGVVERFQATLELDERYELITYAVWNRMQDESMAGRSTAFGFTAAEISRISREWWPAGFAETESLESFAAILDEMEEMGVLARKRDLYALRSQRIAAMLGGKAEIDRRLQDLIDRPPRRRLDPMTSHRQIDGRWSPLTLRQESSLVQRLSAANGARVVLVGAAPAAGLARLSDTLASLAGVPSVGWPKPRQLRTSEAASVAYVAAQVRRDATPEQPRLVIVEGQWPSSEAIARLRKDRALRETARPVRIILCGLPTLDVLKMAEMPELLRINVGPIPKEGLQHWMTREQFGFADETGVQSALRDACGGWLEILEAIPLTAALRKGGADAIIDAARLAAGKLNLADFGLDDDIAAFAKTLRSEIGNDPVQESDMADWAAEISKDNGRDRLRLLEALGVVETVAARGDSALQAFNPVVSRLLA